MGPVTPPGGTGARRREVDGVAGPRRSGQVDLVAAIDAMAGAVEDIDSDSADAFREAAAAVAHTNLTATVVAEMPKFAGLFGRETVYMALTRSVAA